MNVAIMQPYFFPYIGYFQLISSVDLFVIYDNIKYTKKGWINRNRILVNGNDEMFSLPLKKDSDYLNVMDRMLSDFFDRKKLLNKISGAYRKSPFFNEVFPLIEEIIGFEDNNLFEYIFNSVNKICNYLDINTKIIKSSEIDIDHSLTSQDKVIEICRKLGASKYINPQGGIDLYSEQSFSQNGIKIKFIYPKECIYTQFGEPFIPWLSIIDILMFNEAGEVCKIIRNEYDLL